MCWTACAAPPQISERASNYAPRQPVYDLPQAHGDLSVAPGGHHLCASGQSWWSIASLPIEGGTRNAALQLTAAPGGVSYIRLKDVFFPNQSSTTATIDRQPVDPDEG